MRRKLSRVLIFFIISASFVFSQNFNFTIKIKGKLEPISPYIYGSNQVLTGDENYSAMRSGGNRLTGYNWENNASNAGSDWQHFSDNYLTANLGVTNQNEPGIVITKFHDNNRKMCAYSLVTLQLAGYVAKDKDGPVYETEKAPSPRWTEVKFQKGSSFSLVPSTSDNYVYTDEFINFLVKQYGKANTPTGIKGYALDNEPALWPSTHPRIHADKTTCQEIVQKGILTALAVKNVDEYAELFGPALYGFAAYTNFQSAPDWNTVKAGKPYIWFIDYYLDKMKEAEISNGKRLLDVLDVHWYPEAQGDHRITESNATTANDIAARLQAPRTLWDPTYTEKSWITSSGGKTFLPLIPKLKESISKYYPGTKLGITEVNYGGPTHISGALALADAIGIFAKYGVYFAALWPLSSNAPYFASAYKIFRNYDGNKSMFGDLYAESTTSDIVNSSVYSSVKSGSNEIHIIAINKNLTSATQANFSITGDFAIQSGSVWALDENSATIKQITSVSNIIENSFSYLLPRASVCHFILLTDKTITGIKDEILLSDYNIEFEIYPNPFNPICKIKYSLQKNINARIEIVSMEGKIVKTFTNLSHSGEITWDGKNSNDEKVSSGVYCSILRTDSEILIAKKIMMLK